MAHLVSRDDTLDEDEIGELFAHLRGGPRVDSEDPARKRRGHRCESCSGYLVHDVSEGCYLCDDCGIVRPGQVLAVSFEDRERLDGLDYDGRPQREGYKPIHHWHERLAQYHLEESRIGNEDWARILEGTLAARPPQLCKETVRRLLRSLGLQRYNESWLQIINRLTGYVPPLLSGEEMEMLDRCFEGLEEPFRHFRPPGRKNLLNYNFLFYRLLQGIGRTDCLPHFPQLKTRAKWLQLDAVWRQICEYQRWEYRPVDPDQQWLAVPTTCDKVWERVQKDLELTREAIERGDPEPGRRRVRQGPHTRENRLVLEAMQRRSRLAQARLEWQQDDPLRVRKRRRVH